MSDTMTMAYRYAIPHFADAGGAVEEQLYLANQLWNVLVETEHGHRDRVAAIWLRYPAVQAAQDVLDDAAEEQQIAREEQAAYRKALRTTAPGPQVKARMAAARVAVASARAAVKAAKEVTGDQAQEEFAANKQYYQALVKAAGQEAVAGGLYWGTVNDITRRRFPAAAKRAAQSGGTLRFRRFDRTGTLTAQVMHAAGDAPATPALLASGGGKWRNVIQLGPWRPPGDDRPRGSERHGRLRLRVGGKDDPVIIDVPVIVHRWLPDDADVREVKLSQRRVAGHLRLHVAIVFTMPAQRLGSCDGSCVLACLRAVPEDGREAAPVLDVDFSWASRPGTGLRVARVLSSSGALPEPPPEMAALVTSGDRHEVWVPNTWQKAYDRAAAIRGDRDDLFDAIRQEVATALAGDDRLAAALEERGVTVASVRKWRSQGRMAALALRLRTDDASREGKRGRALRAQRTDREEARAREWDAARALVPAQLAQDLELWRVRDRHLWEFEANERDQVIARRNDAYAKIAAWLAGSASAIFIRELPLARLRLRPEGEDSYQNRGSRVNAQFAAPGELKFAIIRAADRRGIPVEQYRMALAADEEEGQHDE
jgi:hypothetical protein